MVSLGVRKYILNSSIIQRLLIFNISALGLLSLIVDLLSLKEIKNESNRNAWSLLWSKFQKYIIEWLLLLVETILQEGNNIYEIETPNNYPPPPSKKNKVNHINKTIITKLSLMHPRLFSKKSQFCSKNKIQLTNINKFTTTCFIYN